MSIDSRGNKKSRASTGGAYVARGKFFARVTVAPGKRESVHLAWCTSPEAAQERGRALQEIVNVLREAGQVAFISTLLRLGGDADDGKLAQLRATAGNLAGGELVRARPKPSAHAPTIRSFGEEWTSGALHRRFPDHVKEKRTADDDEMRLEKWVYPIVGDVPLADFTIEHAHEVLRRLPASLAPGSRRHIAQLMSRLLNMAAYPAAIIEASPLPRGFLPSAGPKKALQWLWPDEEAQLLCAVTIPVVHRLLYGVAHREGMREGELLSLTWGDVDLDRGVIRLDANKTDDPRAWPLGKDVVDALKAWRATRPGSKAADLVFQGLRETYRLAEVYREHLQVAGVGRAELFERTKARRPIRFHDTRASFITVALATGKTEAWVAARTGHQSSEQINGYRRTARTAEELAVEWFKPLSEAIPELCSREAAASRLQTGEAISVDVTAPRELPQFRRKDSNLDKRNQNPLSCH